MRAVGLLGGTSAGILSYRFTCGGCPCGGTRKKPSRGTPDKRARPPERTPIRKCGLRVYLWVVPLRGHKCRSSELWVYLWSVSLQGAQGKKPSRGTSRQKGLAPQRCTKYSKMRAVKFRSISVIENAYFEHFHASASNAYLAHFRASAAKWPILTEISWPLVFTFLGSSGTV